MPRVPPCPTCGETRAEPAFRSIYYSLFKRFGYRLCECGRCRRKRVVRRHHKDKHGNERGEKSDARLEAVAATENHAPVAEAPAVGSPSAAATPEASLDPASEQEGPHRRLACPFCGSQQCRASRRKFWERLMNKPRMLRCRTCRKRFPRPSHELSH